MARTKYLIDVVDPCEMQGLLRRRLIERDRAPQSLRRRHVVSDHGHTAVVHDDAHALSTHDKDDPPAVLSGAGFRVRPFEGTVSASDPFQSVLAYQGALAYVYVADRSTCAAAKAACDWSRPPRYEDDVLPLADAFYRNNVDGSLAAGMKGALDLVLTRQARALRRGGRPPSKSTPWARARPSPSTPISPPTRTPRTSSWGRGCVTWRWALTESAQATSCSSLTTATAIDRKIATTSRRLTTPGTGALRPPIHEFALIVAHPARATASLENLVREYLGKDPSTATGSGRCS